MDLAKLTAVAALIAISGGLGSRPCLAGAAGMAPAGPLPGTDIFAPYVDEPSHVTAIVSEQVEDGVQVTRLRFASVEGTADGGTRPNEIYAILARPTSPAKHSRPGILILHGGNQSPPENVAVAWAKLGLVALAPELPGYVDKETMQSVSRIKGLPDAQEPAWFTVRPSPQACRFFDSVSAALHAFNLLAAQGDVDTTRIGASGISLGGYMTTMLCGLLGERLHVAFSLYGSGSWQLASSWTEELRSLSEEDRAGWIASFDATSRLARSRALYLAYAATDDEYFRPPSVNATLEALPGRASLCYGPNRSHWMALPGGTVRWAGPFYTEVEPAFFLYAFASSTPMLPVLRPVRLPAKERRLEFAVDGCPRDARGFFYLSWGGAWTERDWSRLEADRIGRNTFACTVPESLDGFDWYGGISFTLAAGDIKKPMSLSTSISRCLPTGSTVEAVTP